MSLKLCLIFCIVLVCARPKDDGEIGRDIDPDGNPGPMTQSPTQSPTDASTNNPTEAVPTKAPTRMMQAKGDGHNPNTLSPPTDSPTDATTKSPTHSPGMHAQPGGLGESTRAPTNNQRTPPPGSLGIVVKLLTYYVK